MDTYSLLYLAVAIESDDSINKNESNLFQEIRYEPLQVL